MSKISFFTLIIFITATSFIITKKDKPVFYVIGDSTVKNGDGTGKNNQMGWGTVITPFFDTTKIDVQNHAIGGRSSRTFITDGRWDKIMGTLKKGDYVIMQFGHNDQSPLDDTARARGTIKGIGDDSTEIYNPIRKMKEIVHTVTEFNASENSKTALSFTYLNKTICPRAPALSLPSLRTM